MFGLGQKVWKKLFGKNFLRLYFLLGHALFRLNRTQSTKISKLLRRFKLIRFPYLRASRGASNPNLQVVTALEQKRFDLRSLSPAHNLFRYY